MNSNTLEIRVYDEIGIKEKEPQKRSPIDLPVFIMDIWFSILDEVFSGVENYSRPPTKSSIKVFESTFNSVFSNAFIGKVI